MSRQGDALLKQLVSASTMSLGLRVAGLLLSYLGNVVLSRVLGLHDYGHYMIAFGWASVLAVPARAGFDYSALRYAPIHIEARNWASLRGFTNVAALSVTAIALLLAGAMLIVGREVESGVDEALLLSSAALIFPTAVSGVLTVMMRSARKIFASQFYEQLLRPTLLICLVLAAYATGREHLGPGRAMLLTTVAAIVSVGALFLHFRSIFPRLFSTKPVYTGYLTWFRVSLPLFVITAVQELMNQLPIILLGALSQARAAGLFAAAWRLSSVITFGLVAIGIASGPMIASAFHRSDYEEMSRLSQMSAAIALLFAVPAAIFLVIAGPFLLSMFGMEFAAGYPILLVLTVGAMVNSSTGVVAYLLTLTGHELSALAIFAIALAVDVLLNLILIPTWGPEGAALAAASATTVWNLVMIFQVRRKLGIDASVLALAPRVAANRNG
jgi:O-antigen/teichoic acid export membrane protein